MFGLPLAFGAPLVLFALLALPIIWYLLRLTPPKPQQEIFPPTRILATLLKREETPAQSPWWLTLLRLTLAALVILAMSLPLWNPEEATLSGDGPITLIIDDGWASGQNWDERKQSATKLINEARDANRLVSIIRTTAADEATSGPANAEEALKIIDALVNRAIEPDHAATAKALANMSDPGTIIFFSDGLTHENTEGLATAIGRFEGQKFIYQPATRNLVAMTKISNDPDALRGQLNRVDASDELVLDLTAYDIKGIPVSRQTLSFASGEKQTEFQLEDPVELRNEIIRIAVAQATNPGAVQLLDESNRRRLVGIISGEKRDLSQPLLSPLYYISRALEPFSDIREADNANVTLAVPDLINQGVSAIVLADVGLIPEETVDVFQEWIEKGGMLVRFAGPRMAASHEETLLPVRIRQGDRNLGSALSWEAPKPVANFTESSPFYGLQPPKEVLVTRQILALQELSLEGKTWASLEDGTPLVTAEQRGNGWIVLFHVSSDATWSNLPISGTFVEMLRRVVNQSKSNSSGALNPEQDIRLPAMNILDGQGSLSVPSPNVKPLVLSKGVEPAATSENPPGFYGTEDGFTALNLFSKGEQLTALDTSSFSPEMIQSSYQSQQAIELKPWLLLGAALLLLLDCLAVLWISGAFRMRPSRQLARALILPLAIAASILSNPTDAFAQDSDFDFSAALRTRLAYVITGDSEVDNKSAAGLLGLTRFLTTRTALEPGPPIGLDITTDELAFYSLIYWPVHSGSVLPTAKTMARIDTFMKQGGSILFDTQDQLSGSFGGTASSPAARQLQAILSVLDIPPLEPVPSDHVLTKSFFLLDSFPGRYVGGELWVEALTGASALADRPARAGDGVSSILITSNDMAGAWAIDSAGRALYSTIPPDPVQRTYAFRVGVNLMMYALTGNYKADQVHIPALLERLGQ